MACWKPRPRRERWLGLVGGAFYRGEGAAPAGAKRYRGG